jgi:hypothetical protein
MNQLLKLLCGNDGGNLAMLAGTQIEGWIALMTYHPHHVLWANSYIHACCLCF